ncbi:ABC transporter ATP-binding protein [Atribacter laminatus]|jgi:subfamily B ATP-binding cassette protein MsbA|uniref:Putative ABC transporter ATP-binding protein n=1 Tax=Atribacter laminatus TaxID=2847778 RepID=A0A7T1F1X1_ATRLM|nr:ABC transporter ATP-binding protein [Atribacter laminatus]QPM67157.1 putative ABC transporter ATP-binding protein [Atribacter laminatus]
MIKGKSLFRLLNYLKPYGGLVAGALIMGILGAGISLIFPWLVKIIIDRVLIQKDLLLLLFITFGIVFIFFIKGLTSYIQNLWVSKAGFRVITKLRSELYQHIYSLSASFFQENPTGDIISRMTNDVTNIQNLFSHTFMNIFMDLLILIGSIGVCFYINWKLTTLSIVVFPLVGLSIDYLGKKIRGASHLLQSKTAVLTQLIERTVSGIKIIQSYVSGHYEVEKFEKENELNFYLAMKQAKAKALLTPLVELVSSVGLTIMIWFGGREVVFGKLTPGGLVAFLGYIATAAAPLSHISNGIQSLQQSLASAERIFEILDTAPRIQDLPESVPIHSVNQEINLKDIYFSYGGEVILKNFSLQIPKGEKIGIVGPSGAGKTTLLNLLLRFYDPDQGRIEVDGVDIRKIKMSSLRQQIGVVLQDSLVLGGTVRENILYGNLNASMDEVIDAAQRAHAHEFIVRLENSYDTDLGDLGKRLSGGQKQRIAIARALLKNPPILVLDEATSSLDPESEDYILDTIHNHIGKDKIVILIAHSLRMVKDLDRIVLIKDGEIQDIGAHQELLKNSSYYYQIFGRDL